jgi:hypothetical protein
MGLLSMFFCVNGGRSRIFRHHFLGGVPLTFFALMVGTSRSPALPPKRPAVDIFCVNGGRSRIFWHRLLGGPLSTFFALMVDALKSPASSPRGPPSTIFASMVGAPRSLAPPPSGPPSTFFVSMVGALGSFGMASQGVRRRCFLRRWWVFPNIRHRLLESPPHALLSTTRHPTTKW